MDYFFSEKKNFNERFTLAFIIIRIWVELVLFFGYTRTNAYIYVGISLAFRLIDSICGL